MLDHIPKPDFSSIDNNIKTTKNRVSSPQRPPNIDVTKQPNSRSADNSPNNERDPYLSPGDRKSLRKFLSIVDSFNYSAERLYDFCEHFFNVELTQIAIDQLNKHVTDFRELLVRFSLQQQAEKDREKSILPSPVSFSISTWRNRSFEEWPIPTSDKWVKSAVNQLRSTPPDISKFPKKDMTPLEERLAKADKNRTKIDNIRNREIRMKTNKVRRANELRVQKQEEAITAFNEKQDSAAQRREAYINQIKKKARDETEKVQETRFMQELEVEGRKLKIEKMMNKVTQRYENMVQEKREKAKERTTLKNTNTSPDCSPKSRRQCSKLSVIDAISQGQLPGEFLDIGDEYSNSIPAVELPEFPEYEEGQNQGQKNSQNPSLRSIAVKLDHDDLNPQAAISYLKTASEQKCYIKWDSNEGQTIRDTLQNMIYTNIPNSNLLIHNVISVADISYPFALHVAFECVSSFHQICYKRDTLSTTKELLALWTLILKVEQHSDQIEPKTLLVGHLIRHGVLMKLCYVLEISTAANSRNDSLRALTQQILLLLEACAIHIHYHFSVCNSEFIDIFGHASIDFIIPGLRNFLGNCIQNTKLYSPQMEIIAINIYQIIALYFPSFLDKLIDEDYAKNVANLLQTFYNQKPQNIQIVNELILLIGLLCKNSKLMKESVQWEPPAPTVLSTLCAMPICYIIKPEQALVLIPTIVACCIDNKENCEFVKKNINGAFIVKFFQDVKSDPKNLFSAYYRVEKEKVPDVIELFKVQ